MPKVLTRLFIVALILMSFAPAHAELVDEPDPSIVTENPHIQKLAKDFEKTKKDIVEKEVRQRKVMSSLFEINRKMKKIVTEQANFVQQRLVLEDSTRELAEKILSLEDKLKNQKVLLRERLTAIYKLGGQGLARIVFASSTSAQLEKNLKILGIIAKRDLDLIKDYSASVKELEAKKIKFTKRLAKLKKLEKNILEQEDKLTAENASKSKILNDIKSSKQFALNKLNGIRNKSAQINISDESGVLDLLFRPSFFEKKGLLPPPVNGKITRNFGIVRDEEYNVSWPHKGLFFSATVGTPVKNVFDGRVAFVGVVAGFGNTIIIDHGDHYYSVYSNTKKISVLEGDEVKQHQVIAQSGTGFEDGSAGTSSTASNDVNGLYFEIRHFSEPYDPRSWLKGTL
jgi:septal ring factor EnvC (AmiA/AmiB activator)